MESYRDHHGRPRSRVVQNFGRYDELVKDNPHSYAELCAKYQDRNKTRNAAVQNARRKDFEQLLSTAESNSDLRVAPLLNYGHYVLKQLWEKEMALDRFCDKKARG